LALRTVLEGLGQDLVEARSGEEALALAAKEEFAVILLDVQMPGLDGFETVGRLRERELLRHTPIIFVTAHDLDRSQVELGYSLGAVDFLVKPIIASALKAKVHALVELHREKQRTVREANQLRLLVQTATDYAIFVLDPEGHIATWNPGAERIKGYRADEIIGQHFSRFYPQEAVDRRWPQHELEVAKREGRFEDEGWRLKKDGSQFWANVVITALRDETGRLVGFSKITRDLTERRRAEENARALLLEETARKAAEQNARIVEEQRERLHVTLESIGDAVISTDAGGRVTFLNPVAQRLTGWDLQDAEGQPLEEVFQIINESTRRAVENPGVHALQHGSIVGLANHTLLLNRKGGETPIDDSAAPMRDSAGRVIGVVLVFRDITEQKLAEQALRDADRRKDEFLATLAHELRNPLAPIRNSLQILKLPRVDMATALRTTEVMERQVQHLIRLVDDLLDVSRVMRGRIELRKERIELSAIIARAVEITQPLIESQGHHFETKVLPQSLLLNADPIRLAQVIGNLLTNAAKYTEPNGQIWLTAQREGSEAVVRIRDNGIGIAPDMLPHVFELFVQADHATTRSQGGLGIGLTLARTLVELHEGSVSARSDGLGKGAEFIVRLPIVDSEKDQAEEVEDAHPPAASTGYRLLVVDDNRDAAESLAVLLRFQGHEVRVVDNGAEALELMKTYAPVMIFLDLGMPGMDGYEVARRIRQQSPSPRVVLAALTGWGQEDDRRRSREAGFDHHVVKPMEPKVLEQLLSSLKAET
jgi:PAS domain S-box-containing protein